MAYRRTERVEERLAENRRRILDAAAELMAEGGFRAAQIAGVAAAAGLAIGSVYRYFPSKEELFTEVFRKVCQREVDVIAECALGSDSTAARVEAAVRTFTWRALRRPRLAYALLAEPVDPAIEAERLRFRRAYAAVFAALIAEGCRSGELPPQQAEISAACLVGGLAEALLGPLACDAESGYRADEIEQMVGFCRRAITGGVR